MNIREYISSGIIEQYVLGLASAGDKAQFEQLCSRYPELVQARSVFEQELEAALLADAAPAPEKAKQQLLQLLQSGQTSVATKPASPKEKPVRSLLFWKLTAAASLILLAVSLYWGYRNHLRYKSGETETAILRREQQETTNQLVQLQAEAATIQKPGVRIAALQGTAAAPAAQATVYWDTATTTVYLVVNNLPQPASDKQYQLWALEDGKPIDLGIVELRQTPLLIKMKGVQKAQAFAITLEPRGGSLSPTLDAMQVLGKLSTL